MNIVDPTQELLWRQHRLAQEDVLPEEAAFQSRFFQVTPHYSPVLFPLPMFKQDFAHDMVKAGRTILELILSIPSRVFAGDYAAWMRFQGCSPDEAEFLSELCEPRLIDSATRFARADMIITRDGFRLVEMNIAPPLGGVADCERMVQEFRTTPFAQRLDAQGVRYAARPTLQLWEAALTELAQCSRGLKNPTFFDAVANRAEVDDPRCEQPDLVSAIRKLGFNYRRGLIHQLDARDDGVYLGQERIALVFTAFTYAELREFQVPRPLVRSLAAADLANLVDFIAPPVNILFDNKCNLELLTHERFSGYWTQEERQLISRVLLPTQRFTSAELERASAMRASTVLKPARQFGGTGVTVGANCGDAQWELALRSALHSGEPYVIQQVCPPLWEHTVDLGGARTTYNACAGPMYFGPIDAGISLRMMPVTGVAMPVINAARGARIAAVIVRVL